MWRNRLNADKVNRGIYRWEIGVQDRDTNRDIYTKHLGTVQYQAGLGNLYTNGGHCFSCVFSTFASVFRVFQVVASIGMVSRRSCDLCHMTSLPIYRKWDMGYRTCGKRDILVPIRLSVFRDHILEPRYYDPYLQKNNYFTNLRNQYSMTI